MKRCFSFTTMVVMSLVISCLFTSIMLSGCMQSENAPNDLAQVSIDLQGHKEIRVLMTYSECFEWVLTDDGVITVNEFYSDIYRDVRVEKSTNVFPLKNWKNFDDQGDKYVEDRLIPNEVYRRQLTQEESDKVSRALKDLIEHKDDYLVEPDIDFEVPVEECVVMLDDEVLYGQYGKSRDRYLYNYVLTVLDYSAGSPSLQDTTSFEKAAINMNHIGPYETEVNWSDDSKVKTATIKADTYKTFESYCNVEKSEDYSDIIPVKISNKKDFIAIADTGSYVLSDKELKMQPTDQPFKKVVKNTKGYFALKENGDCLYYGYAPSKNKYENMLSKGGLEIESCNIKYYGKKIISDVNNIWGGVYLASDSSDGYGWCAYIQNNKLILCDRSMDNSFEILNFDSDEIQNNGIVTVDKSSDRLYFVREDGKLYSCDAKKKYKNIVCLNDDPTKDEVKVTDVICSGRDSVYVRTTEGEVIFWGKGDYDNIYSGLVVEENVSDIKYASGKIGVIKDGKCLEIIDVYENSSWSYFNYRPAYLNVQKTCYEGIEKLYGLYDYGKKFVVQKDGQLLLSPHVFTYNDCWMDTSHGEPALPY